MKSLIVLLLLKITLICCDAQHFVYDDKNMRELIRKGLDKSYNFEFDAAEQIYNQVKSRYPSNPAYHFLMAINSYWKMYYYNNYDEKSKVYLNHLHAALALNEKLEKAYGLKPEVIFFYLAIHSSYALNNIQNKENIKALNSAKKTYEYIRLGYPLKEQYSELYFSAGIYDFYREQYPETHPFYKSFLWMFAPGDKQKGLEELKTAAKTATFTKTEANYYLTLINIKYLNDPKEALEYIEPLAKRFPNNANFAMKYTEALVLAGEYDEGEKLAFLLNKKGQKIFEMASFVFYGLIYEKSYEEYPKAKSYYNQALKLAREVKFPINEYTGYAYAGLARIAHEEKDINKAIEYYKKAKEISDFPSIRAEAEEYLNNHE